MLLLALAVIAVGGGAGWYFKIYRPRQERAAADLEDYGPEPDYENTYDGVEDDDTRLGMMRRSGREGGQSLNFTDSQYEREMKKTPQPGSPAAPGAPDDSRCDGCPLLAGHPVRVLLPGLLRQLRGGR